MRSEQRNSLIEFGLLTFGIAWGLVAAYVMVFLLTGTWMGVFSHFHPVHWLSGYGALLGAVLAVFRRDDVDGLLAWFKTSLSVRAFPLVIVSLLIIPALSALLSIILGIPVAPGPWGKTILMAVIVFFTFAVLAEELGWRGVVLPVIADVTSPSTASMLTGLLVLVWRTPLYLLLFTANGKPLNPLDLIAVVLLTLGVSLLNCWLFLREERSVVYGVLLNWSTLIASYALGIEAMLIAGVTVLLAVLVILIQGVNFEQAAMPRRKTRATKQGKGESSSGFGTMVAVVISLFGVMLLLVMVMGGNAVAEYITGIPLPDQFAPLLEYASTAIVWLASTVGVLLLAAALMVAGLALLLSRALGRITFLHKRVKSLEASVQRLEGLVAQRLDDTTE